MRKCLISLIAIFLAALLLIAASFYLWRKGYPRPYHDCVRKSGMEEELVYAVIKAESDFREDVISSAGAVGLMQVLPSTAEYICSLGDKKFEPERLSEGEYNIELGCAYLKYLFERFTERRTVLAAYNAGEGIVEKWLNSKEFSRDGKNLKKIPYPETRRYVKKVEKNFKIYRFLYH